MLIALRRAVTAVTSVGWAVAGTAVVAWVASGVFGWVELRDLAVGTLVALTACALTTIGRSRFDITLDIDRRRIRVGDTATVRVAATNRRRLSLPIQVELAVGERVVAFELPRLNAGQRHEELCVVPGRKRGVIAIGPVMTVRGDPFGLFRRVVVWTPVRELCVHPQFVEAGLLGAGILRDLEGRATEHLSTNDLEFHGLRDYQAGDDRRLIHWRSSARSQTTANGADLLVRQFLDTRRDHFTVVLDCNLSSYTDEQSFEEAVAVAASIAMQSSRHEATTSLAAGRRWVVGGTGDELLEVCARAVPEVLSPNEQIMRCAQRVPETSTVVVITGAAVVLQTLLRALSNFATDTFRIAVTVDPYSGRDVRSAGGLVAFRLTGMSDLYATARTATR